MKTRTEYLFSMMLLFSHDHTSFVQKLNDAFLNVTVVKCSRIEPLIRCHILFGKILCVHFFMIDHPVFRKYGFFHKFHVKFVFQD